MLCENPPNQWFMEELVVNKWNYFVLHIIYNLFQGELDDMHVSTVENHDKKSGNTQCSSRVIEYPTVNRKGGAFSCCGKYRDSPEKSSAEEIQPPPRNCFESLKPPARPPKSAGHLQAASVHHQNSSSSESHHDSPPPLLPPRSDSIHSHSWLSQKKPPLPPVPSQVRCR